MWIPGDPSTSSNSPMRGALPKGFSTELSLLPDTWSVTGVSTFGIFHLPPRALLAFETAMDPSGRMSLRLAPPVDTVVRRASASAIAARKG